MRAELAEMSFLFPVPSEEQKQGWHRIEVEHQLHLLNRNQTEIAGVLREGMRTNLSAAAAQMVLQARGSARSVGNPWGSWIKWPSGAGAGNAGEEDCGLRIAN